VPIYIEQEPGSSGKAVIHRFVTDVLAGFDARGEASSGPKEEYIKPLSAQCQAGNVRLVSGDWNAPFLEEAEAWPFGKHDDALDAVSKAFAHLSNRRGKGNPFGFMLQDPEMRARIEQAAGIAPRA
jgi:predicted phage terminase large subunit-like protein